jgi:hypothetical protein
MTAVARERRRPSISAVEGDDTGSDGRLKLIWAQMGWAI